ncbi:hypothetical protein UPYG_G00130000 [Umbra pygmaea]|uniref:Ig-like domain-containing protein n=1 Tax=Umbra pygmaea TaxID=75934 RepID=A0ABD0XWB4_UMBPY
MMTSVKSGVFLLVLYSTTQTLGLELKSDPVASEGFVSTELAHVVSLTCLSDGAELEWLRNGQLVSVAEGNTLGTSRLCITPVTHDDHTAIFTCHQKNDTSVNASVQLNVIYAPVHSGIEEVVVEETRELVLSCEVRANPPVSVSWKQNGAPTDLSKSSFLLRNDGVTSKLTVAQADRAKHQGLYSCKTSTNTYSSTKEFRVTVKDKTIQLQADLIFPIIAGVVVIGLTTLLAIVSRWRRIIQCCNPAPTSDHSQ